MWRASFLTGSRAGLKARMSRSPALLNPGLCSLPDPKAVIVYALLSLFCHGSSNLRPTSVDKLAARVVARVDWVSVKCRVGLILA